MRREPNGRRGSREGDKECSEYSKALQGETTKLISINQKNKFYTSKGEIFKMEIFGVIIFVLIFILIPLFYTVDHFRNPKLATVLPIENHRMKCESPIEIKLYNALTFNGFDVQTQVPCGRYRIDIALPQYKLAIECDGKAYHSTPEQKAHDRKKNKYLRENGWKVLRFTGSQIHRNLPGVIRKIKSTL